MIQPTTAMATVAFPPPSTHTLCAHPEKQQVLSDSDGCYWSLIVGTWPGQLPERLDLW